MRVRKLSVLLAYIVSFSTMNANAQPLTLEQALSHAMHSNPELLSINAQANSEQAKMGAGYSLENPRIGLMREKNMNFMEQNMGPMNLWSISQEFKFPMKYFLLGSAQKAKASASHQGAIVKKLEVRRKIISQYYGLFSSRQILELLKAQRETLREISRTAEVRHATGNVMQQDEMRAHVEQTHLETEIILAEEEQVSLSAMFNALLDREIQTEIDLPKDLPVPKFTTSESKKQDFTASNANKVKLSQERLREAEEKYKIAKWNYAPDFMLSFKRAFNSAPSNNYAIELSMTLPLWFFMKENNEKSSASAMLLSFQEDLRQTLRDTEANIKLLTSKVTSHEKLLKIYETSLIPQASTTFDVGQSAYRTGKTGFLELLDSERALYTVRIAYYRTLAQYVEYIAQLEEVMGTPLSSLPFGEIQ